MPCRVRRWRLLRRNNLELEEIARQIRPVLTGRVRHYGRFYPSKLQEELRTIDAFIVRWATRKYKRFQGHTVATWGGDLGLLCSVKRRNPRLRLYNHARLHQSLSYRMPGSLYLVRA